MIHSSEWQEATPAILGYLGYPLPSGVVLRYRIRRREEGGFVIEVEGWKDDKRVLHRLLVARKGLSQRPSSFPRSPSFGLFDQDRLKDGGYLRPDPPSLSEERDNLRWTDPGFYERTKL